MSTELAQDEYEADAEDYELARQTGGGDDVGGRPDHPDSESESDDDEATGLDQGKGGKKRDKVVFAIDDEEEEEEERDETDEEGRKQRGIRLSEEHEGGGHMAGGKDKAD